MEIKIDRSWIVPCNFPMAAIATAAQVEKTRGSTHRRSFRITLPSRWWPELAMPRSSSEPVRKVSASSISSVGRTFSMTRKRAAAETFSADSGSADHLLDHPQQGGLAAALLVGDVIASLGAIKEASMKWAWTTQKARTSAPCSGRAT